MNHSPRTQSISNNNRATTTNNNNNGNYSHNNHTATTTTNNHNTSHAHIQPSTHTINNTAQSELTITRTHTNSQQMFRYTLTPMTQLPDKPRGSHHTHMSIHHTHLTTIHNNNNRNNHVH